MSAIIAPLRQLWSTADVGLTLTARIAHDGRRVSIAVRNVTSGDGLGKNLTFDEARTLAFALLQACHEADPGGNNVHTSEEAAIVAAQLATEATAELLRYAREGDATNRSVFADEVCGKLAEAVDKALMIEGAPIFDAKTQPDEHADDLTKRAVLAQAARYFNEFERTGQ